MGGVLGTGVAAGVAQATHQAQQIARQRDKQVRDAKRLAEHQLEVQRIRVEGLEEVDGAEDVTRIRIDNQVPEHEHRDLPERRRRAREQGQFIDRFTPSDRAELLSRLPLPVDTSRLAAAPPEPQCVAAAAYQHTPAPTDPGPDTAHRLDLEG